MGPGIISILVAISAATWLYTKFQKYSGNNAKSSLIASIVSGVVIFGIIFSILSLIF